MYPPKYDFLCILWGTVRALFGSCRLRARRRRLQIIHLGKLLLPLWGEVMADQDQRKLTISQQASFHDVRIFLIQGAGALVHQEDVSRGLHDTL